MNDPYQILNIPPTATDEEVKRAYRDLARKYHRTITTITRWPISRRKK